jgi:hypothetical protein
VSQPNEVTAHFVTFYSPGTFVAEVTTKPIHAWDNDEAIKMMAEIAERYNARPYGFRFTTRGRGPDDLDSKVIATGPMTYVGGKIENREEIEARNDPKEEILRSNISANNVERVFVTTHGWKWTQAICPGDLYLPTQEAAAE